MKQHLILFVGISVLLLSGCNYFKEHSLFNKSADSLLDMTVEEPEPVAVDTTAFVYEEPVPEPEVVAPEPEPETNFGYGSSRFYMIVGSFQNQNLAVRYAEQISEQGYSTNIIEAANGFYRVSAKTYNSYQEGINDIENFRSSVSSTAWLHVKR